MVYGHYYSQKRVLLIDTKAGLSLYLWLNNCAMRTAREHSIKISLWPKKKKKTYTKASVKGQINEALFAAHARSFINFCTAQCSGNGFLGCQDRDLLVLYTLEVKLMSNILFTDYEGKALWCGQKKWDFHTVRLKFGSNLNDQIINDVIKWLWWANLLEATKNKP